MTIRHLLILMFLGCGALFCMGHAPAAHATNTPTCVEFGGTTKNCYFPPTLYIGYEPAGSVPQGTTAYVTAEYQSLDGAADDLSNFSNSQYNVGNCRPQVNYPLTLLQCNYGTLRNNPYLWWDPTADFCETNPCGNGGLLTSVNTYSGPYIAPNYIRGEIYAWGNSGPYNTGYVYKSWYTFADVGAVNETVNCDGGDSKILEQAYPSGWRYGCARVSPYNSLYLSYSDTDGPTEGKTCTCHPVDLMSNLKQGFELDYQNHSPYPIIWGRYYTAAHGIWHFNYDRSIGTSIASSNGTVTAIATREDGSPLVYVGTPTTDSQGYTWVLGTASYSNGGGLSVNSVGTKLITHVTNGAIDRFELHNYKDEIEIYNGLGQLISITSREGYGLHFTQSTQGKISRVTDDFGHHLDVHYPSLAQIATFSHVDPSSPGGTGTVQLTATFWNSSYDAQLEFLPDMIDDGSETIGYGYTGAIGTSFSRPLLSQVVDADGSTRQYTYGEKLILTFSSGQATVSPPGNTSSAAQPFDLTGMIAQDGQRLETVFYGSGGVSGETRGNNLEPLQFSSGGITDVNGNSYGMRGVGAMEETGGSDGYGPCPEKFCSGDLLKWTSITYDSSNHPNALRDYLGNTETRTYDQMAGTLLTRAEATNAAAITRTTTYTWDPRFRLPTFIVEPIAVNGVSGTRTTAITYDGNGHPLTQTVTPSSGETPRTSSATYDSDGFPATQTGENGATTTYAYNDSTGQLASWTDALGHTTTVGHYTSQGLAQQTIDANGLETDLTYDLRDRVTQIQRGSAATHWETLQIVYQASGTGLVDHLVLADGRQTAFTYNSAQWLTQTTLKDSTGITLGSIVYTFSVMGDPTGEQWLDATGNPIQSGTQTYDTYHRLATTVGAAAQTVTTTYDAQSRPLTVKDANGNTTKQTYDALGRVVSVTDALNHTATLAYDPQDAITRAVDFKGNATTYAYNGFGDPVSRTSPDSGTWTFRVDGAGRHTGVTDARGATTAITYDALDRPTSVVYDDTALPAAGGLFQATETQTFTYDTCANGVGELCAMTDASGTTAYTYDLFGRVTSTAFTPVGATAALTVGYGYDTAGRLTSTTYPSGTALITTYGADGQVSGLNWGGPPLISAVTHRAVSHEVTGWSWQAVPDGGVAFAYNTDGQLTQIADTAVQGTSRTLGYDPGGRLTGVTVTGHSAWNQIYGYDANDRLTTATLGGYPSPLSYTYDLNGNRLTAVNSGTTTNLVTATTSNRLNSVAPVGGATAASTYDANGNLITGSGLTLAYDAKNRLASALGGAGATRYAYNAQGQRVLKQVVGGPLNGTERYVYGPGGVLLGVYDASGNVIEETVYMDDGRPLALARGGMTYPILTDQLGTPRQVLDPVAGTPVWTWEAKEPFGSELPNQTVSGTTFIYRARFPGQVFDPDTGLVHNGFRDYLGSIGRYVESDPIGLAGGWNTYGYAEGDSMMSADPSGLVRKTAFSSAISAGEAPAYSAELTRSISYLSQDPNMAKMISQIDGASYIVTILLTKDPDIRNLRAHPDGNGNFTIPWNPYLSPEFFNNASSKTGFISPALGLGHELDHSSCERTTPIREWLDRTANDFRSLVNNKNPYDDMEEERVITGSERENAKFHHEFIRDNHSFLANPNGSPVTKIVKNSISH